MTQPKSPPHASQEKIKRAKRKFDYLESTINGFIASKPYTIRAEVKADRVYIIQRRTKDLPDDIAFEVVEAIGHLRSALDKVVIAFARANGRGISGVGFPFGGLNNGQPEPFPSRGIENGVKKKLTANQWGFIEAQKPYPGGSDALWGINQIANADKHWEGLVETMPILDSTAEFGVPGLGDCIMTNIHFGASEDEATLSDKERERVIVSFDAAGQNPHVKCEATPRVVFGKIQPVQGKDVLVTLGEQIRLTEQIVSLSAGFL